MENNNLKEFILNKENTDSVDNKLEKILSILRKHLSMEVAFISEFIHGKRIFRFINAESDEPAIHVGDSDPLEETYCKRIADNELSNIIHNANQNSITSKLDVTDRLSIGSYMGVPIILSTGKVYGTFCCYKNDPDESLNDRDLSFLKAIAAIASDLIEKNAEVESEYREVTERIKYVLDKNKIDIHFQPIYNLNTKQVSGFESLSRFAMEPYRTPDIWFAEALQVGLGEQLEIMAIKKAIKEIDKFDSDIYISINASPEYVLNGALSNVLNDIKIDRIVLEVTEHSPIKNYSNFRTALEPLRKRGMRLAIDDAGAGYSSFQHVLELEADIIKLDNSLVRNIHSSPRKLLLAKALCAFAKAIKCIVIAEGVETVEELDVLRELGVNKVQGYLLGRPMPITDALSYLQNHLPSY